MTERELYFVEREFAAPVDRLWRAWTTASELEHWYHPTVLSVVPGSVTSEPAVGGRWAVAVDVPMNDMVAYFWGRYRVVDDGVRIEHTLSYSQDEREFIARDDNAPFHRIVIDFTPTDLGVTVRFTQFGEMPDEQAEASRMGMESYFDSLEAFLG
ncbi:MAG: hypothetical protein RLZZ587_817 [Actinomycetota bacterium]